MQEIATQHTNWHIASAQSAAWSGNGIVLCLGKAGTGSKRTFERTESSESVQLNREIGVKGIGTMMTQYETTQLLLQEDVHRKWLHNFWYKCDKGNKSRFQLLLG